MFVVSVMLMGCSSISDEATSLIGRNSPDARLMLLDGSETTLSSARGRYVAVLFWTTWCQHSKGAIVDFEELARAYRRRADVVFFAVSVDRNEDFEVLRERIQSQELKSLVHIFSGNDIHDEAYQKFFGDLVPMVVLIDPRGIVRYIGTDVSDIEDELEERFQG
jgi:thiol-disulfide isomerase/thioredoxin